MLRPLLGLRRKPFAPRSRQLVPLAAAAGAVVPHGPHELVPLQAMEQRLGPLAQEILTQDKAAKNLDARAADFVNTDKGEPRVESTRTESVKR